MKISDIIRDIVADAQIRFGTSTHTNDGISVGMYPSRNVWQVWLERPTKRQLDRGEIDAQSLHTVRLYEYNIAFHNEAPTLVEALRLLQEKIFETEEWPS